MALQLRMFSLAVAAYLWAGGPLVADEPIKVLIVDGQNNHAWRATTPVLKHDLEQSGKFSVDVATSPPKDTAGFHPDFARYGAVVLNYNGAAWPAETQRALEHYVSGGGGLVVVHAANNSFPEWKAYNEMIGLGGWGGRNEKSGPFVRFRDGKIVHDMKPGGGGHHGAQHPYAIVVRDSKHPITVGMPKTWMHATDELYDSLRGPADHVTILATAYSDPGKGGSGQHEPIIFTVDYGKGRVFHTPMGHSPEAMKCVGFIVTLQRGTEWAATGKVEHHDIPEDFPAADKVSYRK